METVQSFLSQLTFESPIMIFWRPHCWVRHCATRCQTELYIGKNVYYAGS